MKVALLILSVLVLACTAWAAETTVWQIGQFDNNYEELAIPHDYAAYPGTFPQDLTFHPGTDDASKSWPFIHPGPADGWAWSRPHPFTILFDLPEQPKGSFTLVIDLVDTHDSILPVYEIQINGQGGLFSLPQGTGSAIADTSKGREYILSLPMPASFFRQGENRLNLEITAGSWLLYDTLKLVNDVDVSALEPTINHLTLIPTIRMVREGSKLKQVILVSAELSPGAPNTTAIVEANGRKSEVLLKPNFLGAAVCEAYVDEVTKPTTVQASVTLGGQTKTAACELHPQKHWKFYIQDSAHVDIGFTDFQERVAKLHNDNMSLALDLLNKYPDFKWNTEAAWVEDNYLSMVPNDRKSEFIARAKEGRIGCQAVYGNMLTGICSHESLIRDLYYAHNTARKYGIPFDIAMSSDVPTQVWTLPTVLAGAGIKYLSVGVNLTRGDSFTRLFNKPLYWQGPDGNKVLTWFSPGYGQAYSLGLFSGVDNAKSRIDGFLKDYERDDYPYDAVFGFGGIYDNMLLTSGFAETVHEWNQRYAYPKIILCRGPEFFSYIEKNFKDKIPTISGDGGVYWEDGAGSSAHETAINRLAKENLVTAEKLFSLASVLGGTAYPKTEFDSAWKNAILYDEHTWGAGGSIADPKGEQTVQQWKRKAGFAQKADRQAHNLLEWALDNLTKMVEVDVPSEVVFNPLSWPVSGYTNGWVENVPPMGYKIIPYKEQAAGTEDYVPVLENRFYRLEINPATGAVKSLYDKELKRELVDANALYGINQYIYITGQGDTARNATNLSNVKVKRTIYEDLSALCITGAAYKTPAWTTTIKLYDKLKRIDFQNVLQKDETYDKEAGYFAFPFGLNKPQFYIGLPNGVFRPGKDTLDGGCMAWYCTQDFVAAADDGCAVVWTAVDSPLITLGDINREKFVSPLPIDNGHLYAYVFNNYWFTNYKASQGGDLTFRFSLTSMPEYDPVMALRFGQSVRNPLVARVVEPTRKTADCRLQTAASLCTVAPANVVIQAVKRAESGGGLIIRLREIGGKQTKATVTFPAKFKEAWSCSLVEDPQKKLNAAGGKVTVTIPANGLATVLVK